MADNTEIATGVGAATRTWSSRDMGGGVHVHRALMTSLSAGGVLLDASPSAPVPVDSELPAAQVPGTADDNTAVPAVAGRLQALHASSGKWRPPSTANADGAGITPANTLVAAQHVLNVSATQQVPIVSASALTDAEAGHRSPGAAQMVYNGAAWERARVHGVPIEYAPWTAITATWNSGAVVPSRGARGIIVGLAVRNIVADPTTKFEVTIQSFSPGKLAIGGYGYGPRSHSVAASDPLDGYGVLTTQLLVYPGGAPDVVTSPTATTARLKAVNAPLPAAWRAVVYVTGAITSAEVAVNYSLIP